MIFNDLVNEETLLLINLICHALIVAQNERQLFESVVELKSLQAVSTT